MRKGQILLALTSYSKRVIFKTRHIQSASYPERLLLPRLPAFTRIARHENQRNKKTCLSV